MHQKKKRTNIHEENLTLKTNFNDVTKGVGWGGGVGVQQLKKKQQLNDSDNQRKDSASMSWSGSSTLTSREIATAEELQCKESEGISEEVPLESEIISYNFRGCDTDSSLISSSSDSGTENEDRRLSDWSWSNLAISKYWLASFGHF